MGEEENLVSWKSVEPTSQSGRWSACQSLSELSCARLQAPGAAKVF